MNIDFIIIGQGLAGSILGYSLLKEGASVKIFDAGHENGASRAAAGIFNPITGRQMRKTWMASELFNYLPAFYHELEEILGEKFYHELPVLRMFDSQKQINDWHGQLERPGISEFLDSENPSVPAHIIAPLGSYTTSKSGFVDVPVFISAMRQFFKEKEMLEESTFESNKMSLKESGLAYKGIRYKKIIFCEGSQVKDNPYFSYLPIVPNKGEILEVRIKNLGTDHIYNKNGFLMPRRDDLFWVGATYERNATNTEVSEDGRKELQAKIEAITDLKYEEKSALAGLRPTVRDRRPLIGIHPEFEQIAIFNGLGSKGVSLAPYWARAFTDHLLHNKILSEEVNISRYNSLY